MTRTRIFTATGAVTGLVLAACSTDQATAPRLGPSAGPAMVISGPVPTGTKTCPADAPWAKIDNSQGEASGDWGSFSYPKGPTITVNVNAGYTLLLCVKSGSQVNDANAILYTIKGPEAGGKITIAQDISHTSWQVIKPPTTELQNLKVSKTADGTYDKTIDWKLNKFVNGSPNKEQSYTGAPGDKFDWNWDVIVNKTETLGNYAVSGNVTVTNPNAIPVKVKITDMIKQGAAEPYTDLLAVTVDCDAATAGAQNEPEVPATGAVICSYSASGNTLKDATLNQATVDVVSYTAPADLYTGEIKGGTATDKVEFTETVIGDPSGTLTDPPFNTSGTIITKVGETAEKYPDTRTCSTNPSDYNANGLQIITINNTATLDIDPTDLTSSAKVTITCVGYKGETATGGGYPWSLTSGGTGNWFMYSPWSPATFDKFALRSGATIALDPAAISAGLAQKVPLIAGQQYLVGEVTATVSNSGQRAITVTLTNGAKFANVSNNVKIHPMGSCTASQLSYVQPGQYSIKTTGSQLPVNVPSTAILNRKSVPAVCYAVHVDVLRPLF